MVHCSGVFIFDMEQVNASLENSKTTSWASTKFASSLGWFESLRNNQTKF